MDQDRISIYFKVQLICRFQSLINTGKAPDTGGHGPSVGTADKFASTCKPYNLRDHYLYKQSTRYRRPWPRQDLQINIHQLKSLTN